MIEVREVHKKNNNKIYLNGFIDLDVSSGIDGKFKFKMKDKSFSASYNGNEIPNKIPLGKMRLFDFCKLMYVSNMTKEKDQGIFPSLIYPLNSAFVETAK